MIFKIYCTINIYKQQKSNMKQRFLKYIYIYITRFRLSSNQNSIVTSHDGTCIKRTTQKSDLNRGKQLVCKGGWTKERN